jgi:hypothetical protein
MTTYIISNDLDTREQYTFTSENELDNPFEVALNRLGYHLNHNTDDGNVHEYVLIENESGKSSFQFMEYMYYRACFEALSELGYSCEKEEDYFEIENTKFMDATNIVPFEL